MHYLVRIFFIIVLNLGPAQLAQAQEWKVHESIGYKDTKQVSITSRLHEFAMEFYCDEHDWQDNRLGVKFFGPTLPRLYGQDGDTAKLSLLFTRRGGVLYREVFEAYYYDGGLGDQAWLGSINAGKSELDALASAVKLDILNKEAELVYSFSTKGTAAGVAKIRALCKVGLE